MKPGGVGWLALVWTLSLGVWPSPPPDPRLYRRSGMQFEGRTRSYYVHTPPQYNGRQKLPLVILFHGGGGGAPQALDCYPLQPVADQAGFILVAPNGTGPRPEEAQRSWNVGFGFGYAQQHQVNDVGFVRALILKLEKDYCVDPRSVYLTGLSNGAILCHQAGAAHADLVTGIAPVSGTVAGCSSAREAMQYPPPPTRPLQVILFHGDLDRHFPSKGGAQQRHAPGKVRSVASARESALFWVRANHCRSKPRIEELPEQEATRYTWEGGQKGTCVVLYLLHNQGHAWPGGKPPRPVSDTPSRLLQAHQIMWDFFASRSLSRSDRASEKHPR